MAYALYCVIPFSKLNNSNRTIKDAAEIIGRSPAALKMKICNLAALDPDFLATGRVGLWGGISKLDREIYEEFSKDWEGLSTKAESIVGLPLFDLTEPVYNGDPHRKKSYAEIADKQARKFFRKSVISAYEGRGSSAMLFQSILFPQSGQNEKRVKSVLRRRSAYCLSVNTFA